MSLIVNGTEIKKIIYNGTELKKLICNGTQVWNSQLPDLVFTSSQGSIDKAKSSCTTSGSYEQGSASYSAFSVDIDFANGDDFCYDATIDLSYYINLGYNKIIIKIDSNILGSSNDSDPWFTFGDQSLNAFDISDGDTLTGNLSSSYCTYVFSNNGGSAYNDWEMYIASITLKQV